LHLRFVVGQDVEIGCPAGTHCWDVDGDGVCGEQEDVTADGFCNALDCRGDTGSRGEDGETGPAGLPGSPGTSCWDSDGDGVCDAEEDVNKDDSCDVLDCRGQAGPPSDTFVRAPVSDQSDKDYSEAQAAAPKVPLYTKGQLTVYGKCFTSSAFETFAQVYVETSAAGSILAANDTVDPEPTSPGGPEPKKALTPWLDGDPDFLDPGTPESDRAVGRASRGSGSFQSADIVRVSFTAASPDGTAINGVMSIGVGVGGVYGSGSGCLFSGFGNG
jgi:hypothetical protein